MNDIIETNDCIDNVIKSETTPNTELHFGMQSGRIVHIDDVENGLSCECLCPHCGGELIAKKGLVRAHHFAHYNSPDCEHGAETAIHLMAKQLISERKQLQLPAQHLALQGDDNNEYRHQVSEFVGNHILTFNLVHLEPKMEGYRPDLTAQSVDGRWLDIEIKVTHEVDFEKAEAQVVRQRDMLEIDLSLLSRTCTIRELEEAVLFSAPRHFIYSSNANCLQQKLRHEMDYTLGYVNGLIVEAGDKQKRVDLSTSNEHENTVMIVGYKFGNGFDKKNQRQFTIRKLYCVEPVQKNDTANFSVCASGGFEFKDAVIVESLIPLLETLSFPVEAQLKYSVESWIGHHKKWIVSEILVKRN